MNRNAKIGITAIIGITLLCLCACAVAAFYAFNRMSQAMITNPDDIAQMRQEIAEYDIPEGYEENGMRLAGFHALMLSNYSASPNSIMLMSFPSNMELSQEEIDQAIQQLSQQDNTAAWEQVDTQTVTIQGKQVDLIVMESSVGDYRQRRIQTYWLGENGMIALQMSGNVEGWDQAVVDAFIASIR